MKLLTPMELLQLIKAIDIKDRCVSNSFHLLEENDGYETGDDDDGVPEAIVGLQRNFGICNEPLMKLVDRNTALTDLYLDGYGIDLKGINCDNIHMYIKLSRRVNRGALKG